MDNQTRRQRHHNATERIIEAATQVFAEAGFAGARVDTIAARAGVNKAMLYYRVGDKEALYARVLHGVFGEAVEAIERAVASAETPEEKLRAYIQTFSRLATGHAWLPPLMLREVATGARHLPGVVVEGIATALGVLKRVLEDGHRTGVFADVDPLAVHMMTVGAVLLYTQLMRIAETNPRIGDALAGVRGYGVESIAGQAEALVLRAVTATGRPQRSTGNDAGRGL